MICVRLKGPESSCRGPRSAEDLAVLGYSNDLYEVQIDVHYSLPCDNNLSKGGDKNQVSLFQPCCKPISSLCSGVAKDVACDLA